MNTLIEFQQVCKYYYMGDTTVTAANHISFQIYKGSSWPLWAPPDQENPPV